MLFDAVGSKPEHYRFGLIRRHLESPVSSGFSLSASTLSRVVSIEVLEEL